MSRKSVIKKYVVTVSRHFPKSHNKSGLPTMFVDGIGAGTKLHTIRSNYGLWHKRIDNVIKGEAVISVRYWTGKPYNSPQCEFLQLDASSGIGLQKIDNPTNVDCAVIDSSCVSWGVIANNDGLNLDDFSDWFKVKTSEPMAIIHFTAFRY